MCLYILFVTTVPTTTTGTATSALLLATLGSTKETRTPSGQILFMVCTYENWGEGREKGA